MIRSESHPLDRFPTCYTLQADGMWAQEEMTVDERGATWVVVGTVTFAEVVAAVGEENTSAP